MIPFVVLNLDVPRKLRFGMGAMVEFEQSTGTKVRELDESLTMQQAAQLLWAMLRQDNPEITMAESNRLVDEYAKDVNEVIEKVAEAITVAFNGEAERPNAPAPTHKSGISAKKAR